MKNIKENTKNWWKQNLANFISIIGVITCFLFLLELLEGKNITRMIIYGAITGLTDLFDGPIARKKNIQTIFGSYLDRIRDRIFIYPTLIILSWQYKDKIIFFQLFSALIGTLAFFELLLSRIGIVGLLWHAKGLDVDLEPSKAGKKKIFTGFTIVFIWVVSLAFESMGLPVLKYSIYILYLGLVLMIYWAHISWKEYTSRKSQKAQ